MKDSNIFFIIQGTHFMCVKKSLYKSIPMWEYSAYMAAAEFLSAKDTLIFLIQPKCKQTLFQFKKIKKLSEFEIKWILDIKEYRFSLKNKKNEKVL